MTATAELAPTGQLVAGCFVFALAWATLAFEQPAVLPKIGRPACMMLCAALAVATKAVTAEIAIEEIGKNVDTLLLLFAMMIIAVFVDNAGLAEKLGSVLAGTD
mmetsp:Transcript_102896/g.265977  ORF Transcript_102896/g.265977 Transcript_102896/m.265977 type:complete len:104 (-) Transcript_102896:1769-2080(-)